MEELLAAVLKARNDRYSRLMFLKALKIVLFFSLLLLRIDFDFKHLILVLNPSKKHCFVIFILKVFLCNYILHYHLKY